MVGNGMFISISREVSEGGNGDEEKDVGQSFSSRSLLDWIVALWFVARFGSLKAAFLGASFFGGAGETRRLSHDTFWRVSCCTAGFQKWRLALRGEWVFDVCLNCGFGIGL